MTPRENEQVTVNRPITPQKQHIKKPLYVAELMTIENQQYALHVGEATMEGTFKGRMKVNTLNHEYIITEEPIGESIHDVTGHLKELIDIVYDEEELH